MLRTLKVLRVFKFLRYSKSFIIIANVFKKQRSVLTAVATMAVAYILISALVIYNVEPEPFENFFDAVYWATVSLTTVGYGDIYPVTLLGRIMGVIITFLGVGAVAIPTGILSAGFVEHYTRLQRMQDAVEYRKSTAAILVEPDSDYAERTVKEVEAMHQIFVTALIRGGLVVIPEDSVRVQAGDILIHMKL